MFEKYVWESFSTEGKKREREKQDCENDFTY